MCQQPAQLRGQNFMELEPPAFCAVPVVLKLAIHDIQPYSIIVSWKGRNHTGLHGYKVVYYPIEDPDYPAAAISSAAVTPNVSFTKYSYSIIKSFTLKLNVYSTETCYYHNLEAEIRLSKIVPLKHQIVNEFLDFKKIYIHLISNSKIIK